MPKHSMVWRENEEEFETLSDILPEGNEKLDVLFIGKVPPEISVAEGHYFKATKQGGSFWRMLEEYDILGIPLNGNGDDVLLDYRFGMTDVVKKPRSQKEQPTMEEYIAGFRRLDGIIEKYQPKVLVFIYIGVFDKLLGIRHIFRLHAKCGFNNHLDSIFGRKVFVFPLPGTLVTKEEMKHHMIELKNYIAFLRKNKSERV